MSIVFSILRRVHFGAAKAVAPLQAVRSARLDAPHIATPKLGLLEFGVYRFDRIGHCRAPLLYEKPRCQSINLERLRGRVTGNLPFAFTVSTSPRVSLLSAPAIRELLHWKPPKIGAVSSSEYNFLPLEHRLVAFLACPTVFWQSLELQPPAGDGLVLCIKPRSLELPATTAVCFFIATAEVADYSCLLTELVQVSADLFKRLGNAGTSGKDYSGANPRQAGQVDLPLERSQRGHSGQPNGGYKKSYSETKNGGGGIRRQGMTIWDLLFPMLQPPLGDLQAPERVLLPADLLPHQPDGVHFLALREAALLGDGVQTGKTVQTIVAMKLLFQTGKIESALVVCPIQTLIHWQKQLEKWAPELWQGLTVVRSANRDERRNRWRMPAHVYATNYETLVADFDEIVSVRGDKRFGLIVADEIQKIKNRKSGFDQLKELGKSARYRWGLSATPLENSIEDIVSIFEFLKPGLLRHGLENEHSAKKRIEPFFLRRRTADVAKHFKEPRHDNRFVRMESSQLEAYELAFSESVAELKRLGEQVTLTHALAKLQALKQLCNVHLPSGESAKLEWLLDTLEEIKAGGDKVLVFTQYIESGRDFLAEGLKNFGCVTYDSQGSDTQKQKCIRRFTDDVSNTVFLANPKVAGVGLPDLKAANYVIHFDHWWNPAVEEQANGRILGIGQKKDAFIVHLWVENSIEGRIQSILARKRDLFGRVIDSQANVNGSGLTEDELFELFGLPTPPKRQPTAVLAAKPVSDPKAGGAAARDSSAAQRHSAVAPQQLSPPEFEDLVARLYNAMGYAVQRTAQTRDGGIDVIAIRDHPTGRDKLAIQCKRQEKPVGRPELQNLLGVIAADPSFSEGVMVTTSTFSSDAQRFVEQNARLRLVDKNTLARLLVQNRVPVKK
jgi:superfamily II DNA or RNA helicase